MGIDELITYVASIGACASAYWLMYAHILFVSFSAGLTGQSVATNQVFPDVEVSFGSLEEVVVHFCEVIPATAFGDLPIHASVPDEFVTTYITANVDLVGSALCPGTMDGA